MRRIFFIAVLMLAFVGCDERKVTENFCEMHGLVIIETVKHGNTGYVKGLQGDTFKTYKVRDIAILYIRENYSKGDTIFCNRAETDLIPEIK